MGVFKVFWPWMYLALQLTLFFLPRATSSSILAGVGESSHSRQHRFTRPCNFFPDQFPQLTSLQLALRGSTFHPVSTPPRLRRHPPWSNCNLRGPPPPVSRVALLPSRHGHSIIPHLDSNSAAAAYFTLPSFPFKIPDLIFPGFGIITEPGYDITIPSCCFPPTTLPMQTQYPRPAPAPDRSPANQHDRPRPPS